MEKRLQLFNGKEMYINMGDNLPILNFYGETDGDAFVKAKDIYDYLNEKKNYEEWVKEYIVDVGYEIEFDYTVTQGLVTGRWAIGNDTMVIITFNVAKEILLKYRTEGAFKLRKYLINLERSYVKDLNDEIDHLTRFCSRLRNSEPDWTVTDNYEKLELKDINISNNCQ